MYCNKDLENNNIDNNINEMFLINFNKKYKLNLDIINNNFKGIYNDCLFVLKSMNDVNIIKNYIYMDELYILFNCKDLFLYYIKNKNISFVKKGFIINKYLEDIQLIDFIYFEFYNFINIIKLLISIGKINILTYHFRYVNLDYISLKVFNRITYDIIKFLIKKKIIIITKNDIDTFNYYKQNNKSYYFKKILKYLKIDIKKHDKSKKYISKILITKKSLKNKKLFDRKIKIIHNENLLKYYKNNNYFKNVKYIENL